MMSWCGISSADRIVIQDKKMQRAFGAISRAIWMILGRGMNLLSLHARDDSTAVALEDAELNAFDYSGISPAWSRENEAMSQEDVGKVKFLKNNVVPKKSVRKWSQKNIRDTKHIILFFGSELDPKVAKHIGVAEDLDSIAEVLIGSETFHVIPKFNVRKDEIIPLITQCHPSILHFDGHGTVDGAIAICSDSKTYDLLRPSDLAGLFSLVNQDLQLVYYDLCYSSQCAENAVLSVNAAIGMRGKWPSDAAAVFARQFYLSLESDYSVGTAFALAREQLKMSGHGAVSDIPKLQSAVGKDTNRLVFEKKGST